ncbi:MAG: ABC transporter permease [Butyrivibrio sp.]|nr:ABC transporter permease [Butyrivibrio sp.]
MKTALIKDIFREIRKTFGKFVSIFGIVLVGVAFFTGVKSSAPYMKRSADSYFDRTFFFDFKIYSTIGFSKEDVEAVSGVDGIEGASGEYTMNALTTIGTSETVAQLMSCDAGLADDDADNINRLTLLEGRMPENSGECALRYYEMKTFGLELGDKVTFTSGTEADINSSLKTDTYTVVGFVATPYYLSYQYDSASIGSGNVELVAYLPKEDFLSERYTVIYAAAEGAREKNTYDDGYFEITDAVKARLEELGASRAGEAHEALCARAELLTGSAASVPEVNWYVYDRNSHFSYVDYGNCADRMDAIAKVFPVFFYLVAALVCLSTMTRMVDEQRGYIGTLKALGYNKLRIALKYVVYAAAASLTGGAAGCFIGLAAFPRIIFTAWNIVYTIDKMTAEPQALLCVTAVAIAVLVTVASALASCAGELLEMPARLLRPKAPKDGRKIFLEKISFIWKKLSFSHKVTARNLLRYKKRFFMTVIGIAGCTALILAGFGIKDSVAAVAGGQYGEIFGYDLSGVMTAECDKEAFLNEYAENPLVEDVYNVTQLTGKAAKSAADGHSSAAKSINLVSAESAERYADFVATKQNKSGERVLIPERGALVTYKLAKDLGLKKGGTFWVSVDGEKYYEVLVGEIVTMYVGQYVFMRDGYYGEVFGGEPPANTFIAKLTTADEEEQQRLGSEIMSAYPVESISYYDGIAARFDDMISSLDIITVVLIISAALLAFVVLYNLITVNISERIREIATIKVLGFYNSEVAVYVYRENVILSIIGALAGLALGVFLHGYIMDVIEMEDVIFPKRIEWYSYVFSVIITIVFGLLVNAVMYGRLKKIPMVESLKSVE